MAIMRAVEELLLDKGVQYAVLRHTEAFTAQEFAAAQHVTGRQVLKVVMLRSGEELVMLVTNAVCRVDLEKARAALRRPDLSPANEEEFKYLFPGCEPGAMPPFGHLFGLKVWADRAIPADEDVYFKAGNHFEAVRIPCADFLALTGAELVDICSHV